MQLAITAGAYSSIALLAVDESLYLVSNKRVITKEKVNKINRLVSRVSL